LERVGTPRYTTSRFGTPRIAQLRPFNAARALHRGRAMKLVKLFMVGFGLLGAALSIVYKLPSYGTHGMIVLVACLVPVLLGALGTFVLDGMPRWAAVISALAFVIAALKTSKGEELQNIMLASAAGLLVALVLVVRPDRRRAAAAPR
jgi:drug/metabolite transporter (DMT)-like permease